MKRYILSAAAILILAGCSSAPKPFGPANTSDFGFRNTQIQNDRFRISYTSRDAFQSRDFALLRAAQIAEAEGYSHFKVLSGETYDNGRRGGLSTGIGIGLGGGRYNRSGISLGVRDIARSLEGDKVTEQIEVILLNTPSANDPNVYSAQSVMKNIGPSQNASKAP